MLHSAAQKDVQICCDSLSEYGEGIAHSDGSEIYVQDFLPGEEALCDIGAPFAEGSKRRPGVIKEFLKQSPDRVTPGCEHFFNCGGCSLRHLNKAAQLRLKQDAIKAALKEALVDVVPNEIIFSDAEPSRYKSIRYFARQNGRLCSGFFAPRSHDVIEVGICPCEPDWISELCRKICKIDFRSDPIAVMCRDCGNEERLVLLICKKRLDFSEIDALKAIGAEFSVKALFCEIKAKNDNSLLNGEYAQLSERSQVKIHYRDLVYALGPAAFLQVNPEISLKMYDKAVAWCGEDPEGEALDLCCGVGTMTLMLSRHFAKVTGIEVVKASVVAARHNVNLNKISNAEFIAAPIDTVIRDLVKGGDKIKAVIADPSRVGLGTEVCAALGTLAKSTKLCAIFCSLTALKRDLPALSQAGYSVNEVQGFDMFPHTAHIETMVLLTKTA